jgi:hypothetical protein
MAIKIRIAKYKPLMNKHKVQTDAQALPLVFKNHRQTGSMVCWLKMM